MALTRTQISLSAADRSVLDAAGKRTGLSMSALIREAIHATYGSADSGERLRAAVNATFGTVTTNESGETLVDSIRTGSRLAESGLAESGLAGAGLAGSGLAESA